MTIVAMYSEQPILTAGLQSVIADMEDLKLSGVFTALDALIDHAQSHHPNVVLIDAADHMPFVMLGKLQSVASATPIVVWIEDPSTEFVSQALAMGVRGVLRKSLPLDLQIKCLHSVAAGDLWVEQALAARLLTSKRIILTRREREVMSLIARGAKNKEIAWALNLAEGTVKVYLSRLFHKVGANDRLELALFARKNLFDSGQIDPNEAGTGDESISRLKSITATFLPYFVSKEPSATNVR